MIFNLPKKEKIVLFYLRYEYVFAALFVLIPQIFLILYSGGLLSETDSCTHALRLFDFIESGSWAETLYKHDNYPFGQILHFTRAMDLVLLVTTIPFLPFMCTKQAILYGSFLYQPMIAVVSACLLIWGGKAFFGPVLRAFSLPFYFAQITIAGLFVAGRSDHHILLNAFLITIIGCLMHGFKTNKSAYFKTAGVLAGLALWTTPEGFLTCYLLLAGMAAAWIFRYQKIREIRYFCVYYFFSAAFCLIINPPMQGIFYADNGRLSVLLVTILLFTAASFSLEEFLEKKKYIVSFFTRLVSLSFLGFVAFGFVLFLFGAQTVFTPPIPPELFDVWTKYVTELYPSFVSTQTLLKFCGVPLIALALGIVAFPFAGFKDKKILFTTLFALLILTFMALLSRRFAREATVFALYPAMTALALSWQRIPVLRRAGIKTGSLLVFVLLGGGSFLYLFVSAHLQASILSTVIDSRELVPYLSKEKGSILTATSRGPEIAWGTGVPVIGTPYHSNAEGIIDTSDILNGNDLIKTRALIKKHQVKTIVLDNPDFYVPEEFKGRVYVDETSFVGKLFSDKISMCFIEKAQNLPEKIRKKYLIYYVNPALCEKQKNGPTS